MQGYTFLSNDPFDQGFGVLRGEAPDGPDADSLPDLWILIPEHWHTEALQGALLFIASDDLAAADTLDGAPADGVIVWETLFTEGTPKPLPDSYMLVGADFGSGYGLSGDMLTDIDGDGEIEMMFTDLYASTPVASGSLNTSWGATYVFSASDLALSDADGDGIVMLDDLAGDALRFANLQTRNAALDVAGTEAADSDGDGDPELVLSGSDTLSGSGSKLAKVYVISASDLGAMADGNELDVAAIDPVATPESWVFYVPDTIDAAAMTGDLLAPDAGGPAKLVLQLPDYRGPESSGGAVYILDVSDAAALAAADGDDGRVDSHISIDGVEGKLAGSYRIVSATENNFTSYLGTLGDLDGDGKAEIVLSGLERLHLLSSRDFSAADALDAGGLDGVITLENFRGLAHSYVIESTDGAFDLLRATRTTFLDHDGDTRPDLVMTGTRGFGTDDVSSTVLVLSSARLAQADGDGDGVIEASAIAGQPGSYAIGLSDPEAFVDHATPVSDMDGDGRAELTFDSVPTGGAGSESSAHLLLSSDLPAQGGTVGFDVASGMPVCFTRGTRIATPLGATAVEQLAPGDLVLTRDHGAQPVRWIGRRHLTADELAAEPRHRPIRVAKGALGRGLPERDLVLSPQHRLLVTGPAARRIAGAPEILIAVKHLCDLPGIAQEWRGDGVDYLHLLFDRHEIVLAEGAPAESLHTGPVALAALPPEARAEIFALFPDLAAGRQRHPARPLPPGRVVRHFLRRAADRNALLA